MKTTIGKRFEMLRTHLNLTQQSFSNLVGITSTQISRIESEKNEPSNATISQVLVKIDVQREWLMDGKGELKAQLRASEVQVNTNWKQEAYDAIKSERDLLKAELNRVWSAYNLATGNKMPGFLKAIKDTGLPMYYLPGAGHRKPLVA